MVSPLVRSSPDPVVRVAVLSGDIALCSWARHSFKAETRDATNRGDTSPRLHCCFDKSLALSLSMRYVAQIQTSLNLCDKSQRQDSVADSDNDFHMSHEAICCSNLSRRRVAAICRIVCLGLDSHRASLHPGVYMGTAELNAVSNPARD